MFRKRILLPCVCACLFSFTAGAQVDLSRFEVGVHAGVFIYQGDLTPSPVGSWRTPAVAAGLQVSRKFSGKLAARLDLTRGGLRGNDARYPSPEWRQQRNFRFTTPVTEATVALVYYPIGTEHKINPYLFAGAGAALLRIRRDFSQYNATYFSRETISEGLAADLARPLPRVIPVVPVGVGVRYPLKDRLYLNTEVGYRVMSSDYLDGFSRAANPDLKDHYYSVSVGLNYAFGPRNAYDCPVIRY